MRGPSPHEFDLWHRKTAAGLGIHGTPAPAWRGSRRGSAALADDLWPHGSGAPFLAMAEHGADERPAGARWHVVRIGPPARACDCWRSRGRYRFGRGHRPAAGLAVRRAFATDRPRNISADRVTTLWRVRTNRPLTARGILTAIAWSACDLLHVSGAAHCLHTRRSRPWRCSVVASCSSSPHRSYARAADGALPRSERSSGRFTAMGCRRADSVSRWRETRCMRACSAWRFQLAAGRAVAVW